MKHTLLFFTLSVFTSIIGHAQCITGDCENGVGTYITKTKTRMEGTWKNGHLNGESKIYFASGDRYEGNMIDGVKSGYGKYVFAKGESYEGNWKNDLQNGAGKYKKTNGYSEEGSYTNDTLKGYASITFSNGDKYEGNVVNSIPEGKGIYYAANGDKFDGMYKNGKREGQGIIYYSKGGTLKGLWANGDFVSGSNNTVEDPNKTIYPILGDGGVYEVNVSLNNVLKLDMVFDTGASEVLFTPDILLALLRTKTISDEDILQGGMFVDAGGNVNKSVRFNLKTLTIGNITINNIPCSVSKNMESTNLLGLSAIKKLGSFQFDFTKGIIKIK